MRQGAYIGVWEENTLRRRMRQGACDPMSGIFSIHPVDILSRITHPRGDPAFERPHVLVIQCRPHSLVKLYS